MYAVETSTSVLIEWGSIDAYLSYAVVRYYRNVYYRTGVVRSFHKELTALGAVFNAYEQEPRLHTPVVDPMALPRTVK